MAQPARRFDGVALGVAVLGLSVASVLLARDAWHAKRSERVDGVVVELEARLSDDHYVYAPVIGFESERGRQRYTGDVASFPAKYELGDQVSLLIDADDPEKIVLDEFSERYLLVLVFGGFGTFGLIIAVATRERRRG